MKLKIPFTEKALKDFYLFLESAISEVGKSIPPPLIKPPRYIYSIADKSYSNYGKIFNKKYRQKKFWQFVAYLKKNGYLKTKKLDKYRIISWTPKGMEKILFAILKGRKQGKKFRDRYLMVVFDIPEDCRKKRDKFRKVLKLLGFKQFQKSIWISDSSVFDETRNLIKVLNLESFVQVFVLEKIKL